MTTTLIASLRPVIDGETVQVAAPERVLPITGTDGVALGTAFLVRHDFTEVEYLTQVELGDGSVSYEYRYDADAEVTRLVRAVFVPPQALP